MVYTTPELARRFSDSIAPIEQERSPAQTKLYNELAVRAIVDSQYKNRGAPIQHEHIRILPPLLVNDILISRVNCIHISEQIANINIFTVYVSL